MPHEPPFLNLTFVFSSYHVLTYCMLIIQCLIINAIYPLLRYEWYIYLPEMEVLYIDIFVRSRLTLAPQQKSLLSGQLYNNT